MLKKSSSSKESSTTKQSLIKGFAATFKTIANLSDNDKGSLYNSEFAAAQTIEDGELTEILEDRLLYNREFAAAQTIENGELEILEGIEPKVSKNTFMRWISCGSKKFMQNQVEDIENLGSNFDDGDFPE